MIPYDTREKKIFLLFQIVSLLPKILFVKGMEKHWNCFVFSCDLDFEAAELTFETSKMFPVMIVTISFIHSTWAN